MMYSKPKLVGYSAIDAIQAPSSYIKESDGTDGVQHSDPAYQADE
jgi:hypothetical protein